MAHRFRRGDLARVKQFDEIRLTLDADGTCDGLPFMPEMVRYCGGVFPVAARVEHVFLEHLEYVARLTDTVQLGNLRCSGAAHGGCQMACHLLWKRAWLDAVDATVKLPSAPDRRTATAGQVKGEGLVQLGLRTEVDGKLYCQATQLSAATTRLPWWDLRQYYRQLAGGQATLGQLASTALLLARNKLRYRRRKGPLGMLRGTLTRTPEESLDLEAGELVEVKSHEEIAATLDVFGKNRGLAFVPEMATFCGQRFRVSHRVDRMIAEGKGTMCRLSNTVALENVICRGLAQRRCPRGCYHLWREIWLRRVPAAAPEPLVCLPQPDLLHVSAL